MTVPIDSHVFILLLVRLAWVLLTPLVVIVGGPILGWWFCRVYAHPADLPHVQPSRDRADSTAGAE